MFKSIRQTKKYSKVKIYQKETSSLEYNINNGLLTTQFIKYLKTLWNYVIGLSERNKL